MAQFNTIALVLILNLNVCLAKEVTTGVKTKKISDKKSTSVAATKITIKKNAATKIVNTKKQIKTYLPFLTYAQLSRLEFTQRVKYIRQLRSLFVEAERAQTLFRNPLFAANDTSKSGYNQELYAVIFGFGQNAYAQSADGGNGLIEGRGRFADDKCIYAYQLSQFENGGQGVRRPFLCEIPANAKCIGPSGPGVSCGELSGITAKIAGGNECVPNSARHVSTRTCNNLRSSLTTKNNAVIQTAVDEAKKIFKLNVPGAKITSEELASAKALEVIQTLGDHRYDDRALAQLVVIMPLYKAYNAKAQKSADSKNKVIDFPLKNLGEEYDSIQPENLENGINQAQANLEKIFKPYINHCESTLTGEEVKIIADPDNASAAKQMGSKTAELEAKRLNAYNLLSSGQGPNNRAITKNSDTSYSIYDPVTGNNRPVRIEDVLEIDECFDIKSHLSNVKKKQELIISSYPQYDDRGEMPTPATPPPTEAQVQNIKAVGCSNVIDSDELSQPAARCMICLAQKGAIQHANSTRDPSKIEKANYYVPSNKWLSLMSTMVLACGDGSSDRNVYTEKMLKYMQTFGHCSSETYAWRTNYSWDDVNKKWVTNPNDQNADLQEPDRLLVRNWSQENQWMAGVTPEGINTEFERIYGVNYSTATDIFCDRKKFKVQFDQRDSSFSAIEPNGAPPTNESTPEFMRRGRAQLKDAITYRKKEILKSSNSSALLDCMTESLNAAEELYSGTSDACMGVSPLKNPSTFNSMINNVQNANGASIVFDGGRCKVSKQIEKSPIANSSAIVMTDPSESFTPNNFTQVSYYQRGPNFTLAPGVVRTTPDSSGKITNYTAEDSSLITYPNRQACALLPAASSSPYTPSPGSKTR